MLFFQNAHITDSTGISIIRQSTEHSFIGQKFQTVKIQMIKSHMPQPITVIYHYTQTEKIGTTQIQWK